MSTTPIRLPGPELPAGPRSALVIATTTYDDPLLRQLRAPATDASGLADVLADRNIGGFEVTSVVDRPAQEVRVAIEEFLAGRTPEDLVVVYFSCHGVTDARRRLHFAATDTFKSRLASTGVDSIWVNDRMEECRARRQVLILDCCFSGAFARGAKGADSLGLDHLTEPGRGRAVLTASSATEYSFETPTSGQPMPDSPAPGSIFTAALLAGLRDGSADRDGDGFVTVDEAYAYAYQQVRASGAAQTPQRWLSGGEGQLLLARNPAGRPVIPALLPESVRAALDNPSPNVRIGAVDDLRDWLTSADPRRVLTAIRELEDVADSDIPPVAAAARSALGHGRPPGQTARRPDASTSLSGAAGAEQNHYATTAPTAPLPEEGTQEKMRQDAHGPRPFTSSKRVREETAPPEAEEQARRLAEQPSAKQTPRPTTEPPQPEIQAPRTPEAKQQRVPQTTEAKQRAEVEARRPAEAEPERPPEVKVPSNVRRLLVAIAVTAVIVALVLFALRLGSNSLTGKPSASGAPSVSVSKNSDLASKLPESIKSAGVMKIGVDANYAPSEFLAADGKTVQGFDIDLFNAVAAKFGVKTEWQPADFGSIIAGVNGKKYDLGISAFTINPERMKQVDMVSYFNAGTQWATQKGNPKGVDPDHACGKTVAVQTGTVQEADDLPVRQKKCGGNKINILSYDLQAQATSAVVSGKADAMLADSPVVAYAVKQSGGKLRALGDIYDAAPYGYVLPKGEDQFAQAIVKALKQLEQEGSYKAALEKWGVEQGAISDFAVNPTS